VIYVASSNTIFKRHLKFKTFLCKINFYLHLFISEISKSIFLSFRLQIIHIFRHGCLKIWIFVSKYIFLSFRLQIIHIFRHGCLKIWIFVSKYIFLSFRLQIIHIFRHGLITLSHTITITITNYNNNVNYIAPWFIAAFPWFIDLYSVIYSYIFHDILLWIRAMNHGNAA
jgi:hypothetical protein